MKPHRRRWVGTFFATLCLSLCVLGLGLAFLLIEWNMQQTIYGRVEPTLSFTVEEGVPTLTDDEGQPLELLSEEHRQTAYALLSTPGRVTLWLLRRQQALIVDGWAAIAPGG